MATHKRSIDVFTTSELAQLCRADTRTVRRKLDAVGVKPSRQDARTIWWPSHAALAAVFAVGDVDPSKARARLDTVRAKIGELELAQRRGELVGREAVLHTWSTGIVTVKARMRALPAQAAALIPGVTVAIAKRLGTLVENALSDLADGAALPSGTPPLLEDAT